MLGQLVDILYLHIGLFGMLLYSLHQPLLSLQIASLEWLVNLQFDDRSLTRQLLAD